MAGEKGRGGSRRHIRRAFSFSDRSSTAFLSLSSPSLFLSVRRASFSWKSVVRAPNGGLKISHRPKIVDSCVRAPSTSSSRCASTVGARREKVRFFFVLLSHFHEEKLESGVITSPRFNSYVKIDRSSIYRIPVFFLFFFYQSFLLWREMRTSRFSISFMSIMIDRFFVESLP